MLAIGSEIRLNSLQSFIETTYITLAKTAESLDIRNSYDIYEEDGRVGVFRGLYSERRRDSGGKCKARLEVNVSRSELVQENSVRDSVAEEEIKQS